jgi:hypothetical protein
LNQIPGIRTVPQKRKAPTAFTVEASEPNSPQFAQYAGAFGRWALLGPGAGLPSPYQLYRRHSVPATVPPPPPSRRSSARSAHSVIGIFSVFTGYGVIFF